MSIYLEKLFTVILAELFYEWTWDAKLRSYAWVGYIPCFLCFSQFGPKFYLSLGPDPKKEPKFQFGWIRIL